MELMLVAQKRKGKFFQENIRFDWESFLNDYGIPFITEGHHHITRQFKLQTDCPLHGMGTGKYHLGLNPTSNSCWAHGKGHSVWELVSEFTNLQNKDVEKILRKYSNNSIYESSTKKKVSNVSTITYPKQELSRNHINYLIKRGFSTTELVYKYQISSHPCFGMFGGRIIIPVYENRQLVSLTARSLNSEPKYLNLKDEKSIMPIRDCLYGYDFCNQDFVLVLEGVTDVWRMGDNSCGLFGKTMSTAQKHKLIKKFRFIFILLDPDAVASSKKIADQLRPYRRVFNLLVDGSDPGDYTWEEAQKVWKLIMDYRLKSI
jgi:hypothetical protein